MTRFSKDELAAIRASEGANRKASKKRSTSRSAQRKTGEQLYSAVPEQYRDELETLIKVRMIETDEIIEGATEKVLRPGFSGPAAWIVYAKAKAHAGDVDVKDLRVFAYDACVKAYRQWRQSRPGPALVDGKLDPGLQSWMLTEADRDVLDGRDRLLRGAVPTEAKKPVDSVYRLRQGDLRSPDESGEHEPLNLEKLVPAPEDDLSWLLDDDVPRAAEAIPDRIDQMLVLAAYTIVHHPDEVPAIRGATLPEGLSHADKENRWRVVWELIRFFCHCDEPLCEPGEIWPRLVRFARWLDHWKVNQVTGKPIPARDGRRSWTGGFKVTAESSRRLERLSERAARFMMETKPERRADGTPKSSLISRLEMTRWLA
jgi:hypothetical protein